MTWCFTARARHLCPKLALTLCARTTAAIETPGYSHPASTCTISAVLCRCLREVISVISILRVHFKVTLLGAYVGHTIATCSYHAYLERRTKSTKGEPTGPEAIEALLSFGSCCLGLNRFFAMELWNFIEPLLSSHAPSPRGADHGLVIVRH